VTETDLCDVVNVPAVKERLHRRARIGVKTSEHDFRNEVGERSIGEDLFGSEERILSTSSRLTESKLLRSVPECSLPCCSGFKPGRWLAIDALTVQNYFVLDIFGEGRAAFLTLLG